MEQCHSENISSWKDIPPVTENDIYTICKEKSNAPHIREYKITL